MTDESKITILVLLEEMTEREITDALKWAEIYERRFQYTSSSSRTPYMIASLVYLYQTAHGQPNHIGKALCQSIEEYDEDEAQKLLSQFRFPVTAIYKTIKDWEYNNYIPHLFKLQSYVKHYEIVHAATFHDDVDIINWLFQLDIPVDMKDSFGKTALHVAAAAGKLEITQCLLACGASVFATDNQHQNPLEIALHHCHFDVAEILKPNLFCNSRGNDGETLLMRLIREGQVPQVKFMLQYADLKTLNNFNQNVLHICAEAGREKVMKELLGDSIRPDILNAKDYRNRTPLYLAVSNKKTLIVKQLLEAGARVTPAIRRMPTTIEILCLLKQHDPVSISYYSLQIIND